jgi:hypothetical protein
MGKLKEQLLNNLTPEEMDERFELSAFEYVEYMENYKQSEEHPNDVLDQLGEEQSRLERDYFEQEMIDSINESNKLKYTDNDILDAITKVTGNKEIIDRLMVELRDIWSIKNGFFE